MTNMTLTEQALVEALNQWTSKQGVVLTQANPFFFMQALREQGLEIVKSEELTKIRYEHKFLREQINIIHKTATAAKTKIMQLDEGKDLLKDRTGSTGQISKPEQKPYKREPKSPAR